MEGRVGIGPSRRLRSIDHYLGEDRGSDGRGRTYKSCGGFRPYTPTISNFLGRCAAALLRQVSTGAPDIFSINDAPHRSPALKRFSRCDHDDFR
jgi:hypothetical protein